MSITTVGNQLIHYEVLGRGRPLLFIHGWLGSWRYWWPSMQSLSSRHRSFAFDLWGFGDSSKTPNMYTLNAYVEMIDQFISQLGISKPVTLVGHSLGAAVALAYTTRHPDSVDKLATVALPLQGNYINDRLSNTDPDSFVSKIMKDNFSEVNSELRKTDQQAMNQLAQELSQRNFLQDLADCNRPTLLVFGAQDIVIQPPDAEVPYLQSLGGSRYLVTLDDCSHFPMLQEKAKFNRLLMDFIHADETLKDLAPKEYWQRRVK